MTFTAPIVIGLEIHIELNTATKLFCPCQRTGSDIPNSRTCPICLGHPGSKPVLNKKAIESAIKLALATKSAIAPNLVFSRKSYFYPDMSKNYQISQYELPLAKEGSLALGAGKSVGITRLHLEEDPASLVHPSGMRESAYVLVDYNRSGNPLLELVTRPELESPGEARDFMKQLITILEYLEIFDINSCIIKADANISIRESNYSRVEIKNITGFKEIERALNYEVARQQQEAKEGKTLRQETRSWDSELGITSPLREKESEEEYGYIIDPDLVSFSLSHEFIAKIKQAMPELAHEKLEKFQQQHGITEEMAKIISKDKELAEMFESVAASVNPELAAKWVRRELPRVLNFAKKKLHETAIKEHHLIDILQLVQQKKITDKTAQRLMELLINSPFDVKE
ncbi:Asp-tRNA(Asn)/Glu-tRNA(Gln) amidotransferase subunit GatB [Candidatus Woesearchaeota archaeon]|nr:Asp-tRNA(Asn)/Glu-tRNA(Gln) amidotransferase subunit GatB [Candidatus Woesearchaeota archaeon]